MDKLKTIIATLTRDDAREFAAFVKRQKKSKNRKDLELFEILRKKFKRAPKPHDIVAMLYPESHNQVAYHALRKRLMKHLIDFIVLKRMDEDSSATSSAMGMISMALYLFDMGQPQLAWQFLQKAEKIASEGEHFDLLNNIYNIQVEHSDVISKNDLSNIIDKWQTNKAFADEDERANIANSVIRQELESIRVQDKQLDFDSVIQEVLGKYHLEEAVSKRPRLFYSLMSIARSAVLVKKDYHAFAPYLQERYRQFLSQHGFSNAHLYYQLSLLYMLAHVFYRSKRFEESIQYLEELYQLIAEQKNNYFNLFYPRYALLMAANLAFSGNSGKAVNLLKGVLADKRSPLSEKDETNIWLNLGLYCFHIGDFEQVIVCSLKLNKSDQYYEKRMGKEWAVRKNLCEMMFQYDLGNIDLAFNKLRAIERNHATVFSQSKYKNAKGFLKLIKSFFDQPILVSKPEFMEKVDASLEFLPFEEEDLQAVSFYAWLKSKMLKCSYYEALLFLTNEHG